MAASLQALSSTVKQITLLLQFIVHLICNLLLISFNVKYVNGQDCLGLSKMALESWGSPKECGW